METGIIFRQAIIPLKSFRPLFLKFRLLRFKLSNPSFRDSYRRNIRIRINEVERGKINQQNAKTVFGKILESDVEPAAYMKEHGLLAVTDDSVLRKAAAEVLAASHILPAQTCNSTFR